MTAKAICQINTSCFGGGEHHGGHQPLRVLRGHHPGGDADLPDVRKGSKPGRMPAPVAVRPDRDRRIRREIHELEVRPLRPEPHGKAAQPEHPVDGGINYV